MDLNEIQELIKFVAKAGVNEVEIEQKDFKLVIKSDYLAKKKSNFKEEPTIVQQTIPMASMPAAQAVQVEQPVATEAPAAAKAEQKEAPQQAEDSKHITIKAQMIGTFYRAPSPDKPPYVEVGDTIKEGDNICVIEAMKLFNDIESDISGKIVKVLVDDASPVEFDQPLFLVDPS
ncbi:MAG: acetyl-CoA carboxylase, biotin carboxyl carrier protein [Crocinitomicaceae bacterium]|nr:acetyl-CoA carboxylase, biotin carboxyl carrier protein [Crocinitomicaceae bacterium]|tara:strand:- start:548 stop:1072 length:525 start_codon:yes stop_codon:yes gene_type:complete